MLYAFIDESERDEAFYFLCAVICTSEQAKSLSVKLQGVMSKHATGNPQLNSHEEFHGSAIMRAAGPPWRHVPLRLRIQIYSEALRVIRDSGCRIYIEGIDIAAFSARTHTAKRPAREVALGYLLERINDCAKEAGSGLARVIADEHHTAQISRSNFSKYQLFGTPGYRSSYLPHLESPLRFEPSETNRLLQAADLVTYIFNRATTIKDGDSRMLKAQSDLWETIREATQWPRGRARVWP